MKRIDPPRGRPGGATAAILNALFAVAALVLPALVLGEDEAPAPKPVLLVARANLPDPNFHDTVVLLPQRGAGGAFGFIVNRPTDLTLAEALPESKSLEGRDDKLFFGGPVMHDVVVILFHSNAAQSGAVTLAEGVQMSFSHTVLDKLLARKNPTEGLRVYAGLAGWAPGQLEEEIERGDWRTLPVDARSIFEAKPETLWPELYRRAFATLARAPQPAGAARPSL